MADAQRSLLNERVEKLALAYAQELRAGGATDEEIVKALRKELVVKRETVPVMDLIEKALRQPWPR